jgi:hypothetical protein
MDYCKELKSFCVVQGREGGWLAASFSFTRFTRETRQTRLVSSRLIPYYASHNLVQPYRSLSIPSLTTCSARIWPLESRNLELITRDYPAHHSSRQRDHTLPAMDPEVVVGTQTPLEDDTEMQNVPDITADETINPDEDGGDQDPTGLEDIEPTITERTGFIECVPTDLPEDRTTH